MSKYESSMRSKTVWNVRASVISYVISDKSSMRFLMTNLQWDDCYSGNCDEMSKYECLNLSNLDFDMCHILYIFHWE